MTELWRFFNICFLFLVICKDFYDFSSSFGRFMVLTGILLCHLWQKVHFAQSQFFLCLTPYYASVRFPLFYSQRLVLGSPGYSFSYIISLLITTQAYGAFVGALNLTLGPKFPSTTIQTSLHSHFVHEKLNTIIQIIDVA